MSEPIIRPGASLPIQDELLEELRTLHECWIATGADLSDPLRKRRLIVAFAADTITALQERVSELEAREKLWREYVKLCDDVWHGTANEVASVMTATTARLREKLGLTQ